MNEERLLKVLLAPLNTEKSTRLADEKGQFAFQVAPDATKTEVKAAVEKLFTVEVESVSILNVKGKRKRFKQRLGRRAGMKKAYVSLKEGHDINFAGVEG